MGSTNSIIKSAICPKLSEADKVFNYVANYALQAAKQITTDFRVDATIKPVIRLLCLYFASDPRFEEQNPGLKLQKGIFLTGNIGTGKTLIMRAFSNIKLVKDPLLSGIEFVYPHTNENIQVFSNYDVIHVNQVCDKFQIEGAEGLSSYNRGKAICLDDLGIEAIPSVHMGNKKNIMEELIVARYQSCRYSFRNTHFTSNLTGDQIEQLYGKRVRSRLREMTNFIVLPGNDRRK